MRTNRSNGQNGTSYTVTNPTIASPSNSRASTNPPVPNREHMSLSSPSGTTSAGATRYASPGEAGSSSSGRTRSSPGGVGFGVSAPLGLSSRRLSPTQPIGIDPVGPLGASDVRRLASSSSIDSRERERERRSVPPPVSSPTAPSMHSLQASSVQLGASQTVRQVHGTGQGNSVGGLLSSSSSYALQSVGQGIGSGSLRVGAGIPRAGPPRASVLPPTVCASSAFQGASEHSSHMTSGFQGSLSHHTMHASNAFSQSVTSSDADVDNIIKSIDKATTPVRKNMRSTK